MMHTHRPNSWYLFFNFTCMIEHIPKHPLLYSFEIQRWWKLCTCCHKGLLLYMKIILDLFGRKASYEWQTWNDKAAITVFFSNDTTAHHPWTFFMWNIFVGHWLVYSYLLVCQSRLVKYWPSCSVPSSVHDMDHDYEIVPYQQASLSLF